MRPVFKKTIVIGYTAVALFFQPSHSLDTVLSQPEGAVIMSIKLQNYKYTATLNVASDLKVDYEAYVMDNPPRIILDPIGTAFTDINAEDIKYAEGLIQKVDIVKGLGTPDESDGYYVLDFISIRLKNPSSFHLKKSENSVSIDMGGEGEALYRELDAMLEEKNRQKLLDETRDEKVKEVASQIEERLRRKLMDGTMARVEERDLLQAEVEEMKASDISKIREDLQKAESVIEEKLIAEAARDVFMPKSFIKGSERDLKQSEVMLEAEEDVLKKLKAHREDKEPLDLEESFNIALSNYGQAKVQQEEVSLAQMKVNEAWRALYPQANVELTQRTGNVEGTEAQFTERSYAFNVEQPLFYGGRLVDTLKKSKVNVDVANMKYEKTKNELYYNISEIYYNLVTSYGNISLQKDLIDACKRYLSMSEARYKAGLSTQYELMNVRSKYNQIYYQLVAADKDLSLAKLKFNQALGLSEDTSVGTTEWRLPFKNIDVDLDEINELAMVNNPDIRVNERLVEFNKFEERVAKKKDALKVDLTGTLGASGSAFETEPLRMTNDVSFGIKVTKGWGGSTASYTAGREALSPKTGQRDRTESNTNTARITLLDDLEGMYEKKESEIAVDKAMNDLKDAKMNLIKDSREAYFGYQEAVIQVRNSLEKVKFRMEALKFSESELELNQSEISQVLEARINLTDEQHQYLEALSNYHISLAKLNKVIGVTNYFKTEEIPNGPDKS